jgi:hypothetical protein
MDADFVRRPKNQRANARRSRLRLQACGLRVQLDRRIGCHVDPDVDVRSPFAGNHGD